MNTIFVLFCFDNCRRISVNSSSTGIIIAKIIWKSQRLCWHSHITKVVCSHNCLGWAIESSFGSTTRLSTSAGFMIFTHCWLSVKSTKDSQESLINSVVLKYVSDEVRFSHEGELWSGEHYWRAANHLSVRLGESAEVKKGLSIKFFQST